MNTRTIIMDPTCPALIGASLLMVFGLFLTLGHKAMASSSQFDYSEYDKVLQTYVNEKGMVDYEGLKANRAPLDRFHEKVASLDRESFEKWPDPARIAFWINIYNSLTLKTIINHYPIERSLLSPSAYIYPENSIRQISGVWDEITHEVMGENMTLDQIEHEVLRKDFNEPRIHVALVCAAKGCPVLRNEPYTGPRLDEQLKEQSRIFINNPEKFRIDKEAGLVHLSSIFKWFGADFVKKYSAKGEFKGKGEEVSAVLEFASKHLDPQEVEYLKDGDYSIDYLDYDWSLNEQDK